VLAVGLAVTVSCGGGSDDGATAPTTAVPTTAVPTTAVPTTAVPTTAPGAAAPPAVEPRPALRGEDLSDIRMRDLTSGAETTLEAALAAPNDTPVLAFFWAPY